jgi:primosomal protein N' (replication factor Y)
VAGRAGRGEIRGEAIVQTLFPTHYSIRLACTQDYPAFFEKETAFRLAMRYPPHVAMVNVVVKGRTFEEAMGGAQTLAAAVRGGASRGFVLLGPAPAPLTRLRGEHRAQFFLKGTHRAAMRDALRAALEAAPAIARRASVDVDPVTML